MICIVARSPNVQRQALLRIQVLVHARAEHVVHAARHVRGVHTVVVWVVRVAVLECGQEGDELVLGQFEVLRQARSSQRPEGVRSEGVVERDLVKVEGIPFGQARTALEHGVHNRVGEDAPHVGRGGNLAEEGLATRAEHARRHTRMARRWCC